MDPDDVKHVIALELALLTAAVRGSRERLEALLDPGFREVGASGRRWERAEMIDALVAEATPPASSGGDVPADRSPADDSPAVATAGDGPAVGVEDVEGFLVGPDLVLVSYVSDPGGRRARRTSLWRRSHGAWRLLHHQGTLAPRPA